MKKTQKKEEILNGDIRDKVKSFEDAYQFLGLDPKHLPVVDNLPEKDQTAIVAFYKLTIIIRALNEGWEPDWKNWNEYKYYNYFYMRSASCFVYSYTTYAIADTSFGSRLCFKSRELAEYALSQFKELYLQYLLIDMPDASMVE
jgi:hypothetical protein